MDCDAIVLAGGLGSRLGGTSKALLRHNGATLIDLAIRATAGARQVVVVGDADVAPGYLVVRESPPYSGPVAAIAAGLAALRPDSSPHTLVLACDMPGAGVGVELLLKHEAQHSGFEDTRRGAGGATGGTTGGETDGDTRYGAIAVDEDGREQYLLAIYSTSALRARLDAMNVTDASMRKLTHGMDLDRVLVPASASADVDTWADAAALGVTQQLTQNM